MHFFDAFWSIVVLVWMCVCLWAVFALHLCNCVRIHMAGMSKDLRGPETPAHCGLLW